VLFGAAGAGMAVIADRHPPKEIVRDPLSSGLSLGGRAGSIALQAERFV
jgi:hypothetical protein